MDVQQRAASIAYRGILIAVSASPIEPERRKATALYLLVTLCNVPGAVAARAAGCSKQNVSQQLQAVEDRRELQPYEAQLSALEGQFSAEVFQP